MRILDAIEQLKEFHKIHGNVKLSLAVDVHKIEISNEFKEDDAAIIKRNQVSIGYIWPDEISIQSFNF